MFTTIDTIKRALRIINVLDASQPLQSTDRNDALSSLNTMLASWQAQYNHLWLKSFATLIMEKGKQGYSLGTDRAINDEDLAVTTTTASYVATDTVIGVSSVTGISALNVIGVYLDDGTFHWTTVASVAGTDVTLTDALPSASTSGSVVYSYAPASIISRPLKIDTATYIDRALNGGEIPLEQWSRREYMEQTQKLTQGSGSAFYYSPQLTNGVLYVWPTASSNLNVVKLSYTRPFTTLVNNDDAVDAPDEWRDAIEYGLAARLATEYGLPEQRIATVKAQADEFLSTALAFDNEAVGMEIQVEFNG